ncbi:MAG: tRNA lysidine(34) synthetase TilS, partial [Rhodothalassiaceae bacterium]
LHVDHGLRPDSATEARQVLAWLEARGIPALCLRWQGRKPTSRIQARAREARYGLLEDWCRAQGVAALVLAHQADDVAETFLLRLLRGSGLYGLAAIPPVAPPLTPCEVLPRRYRPLLAWPRSRLAATCRAAGQPWLEDPGNRDSRFARTHVRALLAAPPLPGLDAPRLVRVATGLARARAALEDAERRHIAAHVGLDERGYALLATTPFLDAPEEIVLRALTRLVTALGGRTYPPRQERIRRALAAIRAPDFRGLALGGCLVRPLTRDRLLLCREPAAVAGRLLLADADWRCWDGRYKLRLAGATGNHAVAALGSKGWRMLRAARPDVARQAPPHPARLTLPALFTATGRLLGTPHLGWVAKPLPFDVISCIGLHMARWHDHLPLPDDGL